MGKNLIIHESSGVGQLSSGDIRVQRLAVCYVGLLFVEQVFYNMKELHTISKYR